MFCPECGTQQPEENAQYCMKCGAPLTPETQKIAKESAATASQAAPVAEKPAAGSVPSAPVSAPSNGPKMPMDKKLIGIIAGGAAAVVIVVLVIVFAVLPSCSKDSTTSTTSTAPSDSTSASTTDSSSSTSSASSSDSTTTTSTRADMEVFLGDWVAYDSTDPEMNSDWFIAQEKKGSYIILSLKDDGTGVFYTNEGNLDLKWIANSAATATATIDSNELKLEYQKDELTMVNAMGLEMYFIPADQVDMSSAGSNTSSSSSSSSSPQVKEGMQRIGNDKVGYLQVPTSWTDRTSDYDPKVIEATAAVNYVDSSTEFTSAAFSHFMFAKSISMGYEQADYKAVTSRIAATYQSDGHYGALTDSELNIGGRNATLLVSSVPDDNLNVATLVIDRDGDGKYAVAIGLNCGAADSSTAAQEVLSYAATWTAN